MDSVSEYLIELLGPVGDLEARKMFGGIGLYSSGRFFGIIFEGRLYFKVNEETRIKYEEAGMEPFRPGNKPPMRSYYEVPPEVIEDETSDLLLKWAAESAGLANP